MDKETFCNDYCPCPFRDADRTGELEVDCDFEESECPFKGVNFSKVNKYDYNVGSVVHDVQPPFKINMSFPTSEMLGKHVLGKLETTEAWVVPIYREKEVE